MILVSVQFVDTDDARFNGGFGIHFYNLSEAKNFAESESTQISTKGSSYALCRVYNDGILVEAWENGVDITP